jgi:hypothetical protein
MRPHHARMIARDRRVAKSIMVNGDRKIEIVSHA